MKNVGNQTITFCSLVELSAILKWRCKQIPLIVLAVCIVLISQCVREKRSIAIYYLFLE